jgi:hypothetical protein
MYRVSEERQKKQQWKATCTYNKGVYRKTERTDNISPAITHYTGHIILQRSYGLWYYVITKVDNHIMEKHFISRFTIQVSILTVQLDYVCKIAWKVIQSDPWEWEQKQNPAWANKIDEHEKSKAQKTPTMWNTIAENLHLLLIKTTGTAEATHFHVW